MSEILLQLHFASCATSHLIRTDLKPNMIQRPLTCVSASISLLCWHSFCASNSVPRDILSPLSPPFTVFHEWENGARPFTQSLTMEEEEGREGGRRLVVIVRMSRVSPINRAKSLAPDFSQTFTFVSLEPTRRELTSSWCTSFALPPSPHRQLSI